MEGVAVHQKLNKYVKLLLKKKCFIKLFVSNNTGATTYTILWYIHEIQTIVVINIVHVLICDNLKTDMFNQIEYSYTGLIICTYSIWNPIPQIYWSYISSNKKRYVLTLTWCLYNLQNSGSSNDLLFLVISSQQIKIFIRFTTKCSFVIC